MVVACCTHFRSAQWLGSLLVCLCGLLICGLHAQPTYHDCQLTSLFVPSTLPHLGVLQPARHQHSWPHRPVQVPGHPAPGPPPGLLSSARLLGSVPHFYASLLPAFPCLSVLASPSTALQYTRVLLHFSGPVLFWWCGHGKFPLNTLHASRLPRAAPYCPAWLAYCMRELDPVSLCQLFPIISTITIPGVLSETNKLDCCASLRAS
jgi:hypothetical protein